MGKQTATLDFSLVIPTYNEKENIVRLIRRILKILPPKSEILVVDDNSPDGTAALVRKTFRSNKKVSVLLRTKEKSLSSAVIDGISKAKGRFVGVIDADLQHDEQILPQMIQAARKQDLVIGSRYIKGGGVAGWSKHRLFLSKLGSLLARVLLGVKVSDPLSGYFVVRKSSFMRVKPKLNREGFKVLLDYYWHASPERVREIPYVFKPRTKGKSKLGFDVNMSYAKMILSFFFQKSKRLAKFCVVGFSGLAINMFILYALTTHVGLFYALASPIAIECSILSNFLFNYSWTWSDKKQAFSAQMGKYHLVTFGGAIINYLTLILLTSIFGIYYLISNLVGIALATIWNFSANNHWTFH